ncbi:ABC transporter permease [Prosthecomicrobium hirschii]|uniref:ABC transporter permease n=1 Tax=Prosthecodimorpha hirschii TaxID=665126 RepID=UPI00221EF2FA|nr:ABC transporter permease [Prosthecomicrobium hirschii]MCW1842897.1 ABC transporter permease [Prosthecomicrobium hirschii]
MMHAVRRHGPYVLILPGFMLLAGLFVLPVGQLLATSFGDPAGAFVHYERILTQPVYLRVILRTLTLSAATAALCLILGYPLAYQLNRSKGVARGLILLCILIPFWTNLLVRSYGWIVLLNPQGVINGALREAGLVESGLPLVYNTTGVLIGMTQIMLPYMVLPLAAVMSRIDPRVMDAARSLGASPRAAFLKVYVPLTLTGALGGVLLVFMISLGFFVVPAMLGGQRDILLAQLIEFNVNQTLNWPFAGALSAVLLVSTLVLYAFGDRFLGLRRLWGAE